MRKVLTFTVIAVLLLINYNLIKASVETSQKLSEIGKEAAAVKELEEKHRRLKEELTSRSSDYFIEQEARNRLGYGKAGETSIVIESSEIEKAAAEKIAQQKSNIEKWLELVRF